MSRPTKYLPGPPIQTLADFDLLLRSGRYIIDARSGQRVNPGWAGSWQYRMVSNLIAQGRLLRALPNPEHPDNQEKKTHD